MNWIKTYESFLTETINPAEDIVNFEKLIGLPVGIGIIIDIQWDHKEKSLVLTLANKLNSFDIDGTHNAIEKHKKDIQKKYPGVKDIQIGATTIRLT